MRESFSSYHSQTSQGAEGSGPSQESDTGTTPVTPHNESSQHLGERQSFECFFNGCPKTFVQERSCRRHYDEKHGDTPPKICQGSPDCDRKWIRHEVYRRHLKTVHRIEGDKADKLVGRSVKRRPGKSKVHALFQTVIEPAFREDALPTEDSNIHVEFRLPPVNSTTAISVSEDPVEQSIFTPTDLDWVLDLMSSDGSCIADSVLMFESV